MPADTEQPEQPEHPQRVSDAADTAAVAEQVAMEDRLRRAASRVHTALAQLDAARADVRAQILEAAADGPAQLSRNHIARITRPALARRLVLQLLAGHDLMCAALAALPANWPSVDPAEPVHHGDSGGPGGGPGDGEAVKPPVKRQQRGLVIIELLPTGDVQASIARSSPADEQRAAARATITTLAAAGLHMTTTAGALMTPSDLAAGASARITIKDRR